MLRQFRSEKTYSSHLDLMLAALLVLLSGLGLCVVYSVTYVDRGSRGGGLETFEKQLLVALIGLLFNFGILSQLDLRKWRGASFFFSAVMCLLILLPLIPGIGLELKGAKRWVSVGPLSFQPSEFLKPFVVFYAAHRLDRGQGRFHSWLDFLKVVLVPMLMMGLVLAGRDFSTTVVIFLGFAVVLWVGNFPKGWFFGLLAFALLILTLYTFTRDYPFARIVEFFKPQESESAPRTQEDLALNYWRMGGFWGEGLGLNVMSRNSIPEAQSDFVLATIARSVGVFGILFILFLFVLLGVRSFYLSYRLKQDFFLYLVGIGSVSMILIQFFLNVAVNAALLPTTGIPCPFFSTGASSLSATMILCGFLLSVSKHIGEVREVRFG